MSAPTAPLPPDDPERAELHREVHARPPTELPGPATVFHVALLNAGVSREQELAALERLPGDAAAALRRDDLDHNFVRLSLPEPGASLKWERHTEFTRYTLVRPGTERLDATAPVDAGWFAGLPGRTIAAIELRLQHADVGDGPAALAAARRWFGEHELVISKVGRHGHSLAFADFALRDSGIERMLVLTPPTTAAARAGRLTQRLLEIETYRMMALRGLPAAKSLAPLLGRSEAALADITARLDAQQEGDKALLDRLISLAAGIERATAEHMYRFSATEAYAALVAQRIGELHEQAAFGAQTIGEFMQRRLSPAIATVGATAQRLASLAQRVERAGALLRTRVDIATEAQSRQLLEQLTRGQNLQLKLQRTVEGLSIAAISYYVVSLVHYAAKAGKLAGLPLSPELVAGASIPFVLAAVAWLIGRLHRRLEH
jgi:uncharacterized membrane-anchored protein